MKKILTLLIGLATVGSVFAQSRKIDETRGVVNGQSKDRRVENETGSRSPDGRSSTTSRQEQIDQVNREYDRRIQAVRANPILSAAEKDRRIRELEIQRDRRIREINGGSYGDRNTAKNKKNKNGKGNNGKHLGWEKGVGNPHRTGNTDRDYKRNDDRRDYDHEKHDREDHNDNYSKSKSKSKGKGKNK